MNIWFLRMDKDNINNLDLDKKTQFIHSQHGTCSTYKLSEIERNKIFPELLYTNSKDLFRFIHEIKQKSETLKNTKKGCDRIIINWLFDMKIGDIVIVRNKENQVFLTEITGYVIENFFNKYGSFQRPVEIIKEIKESDAKLIWHRTKSRKTLERNNDQKTKKIIESMLS